MGFAFCGGGGKRRDGGEKAETGECFPVNRHVPGSDLLLKTGKIDEAGRCGRPSGTPERGSPGHCRAAALESDLAG